MAGENANLSIQDALRAVKAALDAAADGSAPLTVALDGITELGDVQVAGNATIATIEAATFESPAPILRWETYSGEFDDEGEQVAFNEAAAVIEIENLSSTDLIAFDTAPDPESPPSIPTPPSTPSAWTQEANSVPVLATLRLEGTIGSLAFCAPAGKTVAVRVRAGFTTEA